MMQWKRSRFFLLVLLLHGTFWGCVCWQPGPSNMAFFSGAPGKYMLGYAATWLLYLLIGLCLMLLCCQRPETPRQCALEGGLVSIPFLFYSLCSFLPGFQQLPPLFMMQENFFAMFFVLSSTVAGLTASKALLAFSRLRRARGGPESA